MNGTIACSSIVVGVNFSTHLRPQVHPLVSVWISSLGPSWVTFPVQLPCPPLLEAAPCALGPGGFGGAAPWTEAPAAMVTTGLRSKGAPYQWLNFLLEVSQEP